MKNTSIHSFEQAGSKVIIFGDIHGEFEKMKAILDQEEDETSLVLFLGDIIDRGPDSEKCLRFVLDNYHSVIGNHEDLMVCASEGGAEYNWVYNGGGWCDHDTAKKLSEKVKTWPTAIELDLDCGARVGLVHSQVPSAYKTWDEFCIMVNSYKGARDGAMWDRHLMLNPMATCELPDIDMVIGGHTVVRSPTTAGKHIDIDTGACFGKPLTALVFDPGVELDGYRIVQSIQLSDGTYRADYVG